jgi:ubiquinone/menaquinone biosynthesis C-methylase UbiE
MNSMDVPPAWRLPEGVDAPLWHYTHTARLAAEEDAYFADHPLFRVDAEILDRRFANPGRLIDLGCGAGRHSIRFAIRGFDVTAVDFSRPMLEVVGHKAREEGVTLLRVQANLCHLAAFPDGQFDYALSMFSTLGMIRGRAARARALAEAARLLRRGGRIAIHAHNLWLNLRDPQGRSWLLRQIWDSAIHGREFGNRRMNYRGISGMSVHLYRWGELSREIRSAGLRIDEVLPLDEVTAAVLSPGYFANRVRAGGWIIFASRP